MKLLIKAALIISCISVSYADAGRIIVINRSGIDLMVTWSGTGCWKQEVKLNLVCTHATLSNNITGDYAYPWGVTTTWLNIGIAGKGTTGATINMHPCSYAATAEMDQYCLFDHHVIDTDAWKMDECTITRENDVFALTCRRL